MLKPNRRAAFPRHARTPRGGVQVKANSGCRSDWHGWVGHDADIHPPPVPGHELAGLIAAVGKDVTQWHIGDRVTVPFGGGGGACPQCVSGNPRFCRRMRTRGSRQWANSAFT